MSNRIKKELKFKHGIKVVVGESSDDPPLGVIVDIYHKDELLDTMTIWYDDFTVEIVVNAEISRESLRGCPYCGKPMKREMDMSQVR